MRNLHVEGVRPTDPWFLEILRDLGVDACPDKDKMALYRFFMGEKLNRISTPTQGETVNTVKIPIEPAWAGDIDSFFEKMKHALSGALDAEGINMGAVQQIDVEDTGGDDGACFEVSYLAPESDCELDKRRRKANVFNALLMHQKEIYSRIDKRFSC